MHAGTAVSSVPLHCVNPNDRSYSVCGWFILHARARVCVIVTCEFMCKNSVSVLQQTLRVH